MTGVIALVVAHWGLTTDSALGRGMFNFDSLWYHMPFAADIAQSHSVTGFHHPETVFANWFYPQNSELLHADGILLAHRDTLSLFLNYGWLAIAFLAAWCIGRPYGRGHLSVVAVAILLECHILIVREPGAAKNDLAVAALLLAAIAILITAWAARSREGEPGAGEGLSLPVGWPLAAAGLAVGLAAGTKVTVLALAGALSVAVLVLAPAGRRRAAAAWWFLPALLGGGYWYVRNLIAAGNPIPEIGHLGPLSLPHPEHLQTARPDFDIAHYATDTGVWSDYFFPGLHHAFGGLWPLVPLAGPRRRGPGAGLGPQPGPALARRGRPLRLPRLPLHAAQRRRPAGRTDRLRAQHPLPAAGAARRARAAAAAPRPRRPPPPVGPARRPDRPPRPHRPLRRRPARSLAPLRHRPRRPARAGPRGPARAEEVPRPLRRRARRRLRGAGPGARRDRLPGPARLPRRPLPQRGAAGRMDPRLRPRLRLPLGPGHPRLAHRPRRDHGRLPPVRLLRRRPLQRGRLPGQGGPPRRLQRDPDLPGIQRAVDDADLDYLVTSPFLNFIHSEADPLAGGALAARRRATQPGRLAPASSPRLSAAGR